VINVAIVGVGNCASALVQGVEYYRDADLLKLPGIMHPVLGGYGVGDIKFVAAFDVDKNKVGKDLSEAIFSAPNNTYEFAQVPILGTPVHRGMTHDGIGRYLKDVVQKARGPTADVAGILNDTRTDMVINYLPVGSEEATKWYVEQALIANCAFINCIPVFIASDKTGYWPSRFTKAGLPLFGDDVKSQLGATILHRVLARLFEDRGVKLERTYQLNFGGNTDFLNMLERDRTVSKKISKTGSVQSQLARPLDSRNIHVGPSDHVPWLDDRKWCSIRLEGTGFGDTPITVELKLEVWDSPNSAGVVIDAIRCCKLALDRGLVGAITDPSAYFFKTPPEQFTDERARELTEEFIKCDTP